MLIADASLLCFLFDCVAFVVFACLLCFVWPLLYLFVLLLVFLLVCLFVFLFACLLAWEEDTCWRALCLFVVFCLAFVVFVCLLPCMFVFLFVCLLDREEDTCWRAGSRRSIVASSRILHGISTGLFQGFSRLKFFMGFHSWNPVFFILSQRIHVFGSNLMKSFPMSVIDLSFSWQRMVFIGYISQQKNVDSSWNSTAGKSNPCHLTAAASNAANQTKDILEVLFTWPLKCTESKNGLLLVSIRQQTFPDGELYGQKVPWNWMSSCLGC